MLDDIVATPFETLGNKDSLIMFPIATRSLGWQKADRGFELFGSHKAIIRILYGAPRVLNVVSNTYNVVHNRELFSAIENTMTTLISPSGLAGVKIIDSVAHFGRMCFRQYIFPNLLCSIGAKSSIGFRVVVSNAYGGASIRLLTGAIEFYCSNGMITGDFTSTYHRHTRGLQIDRIGEHIKSGLIAFTNEPVKWARWCEKTVTREETMALFTEIASSPRQAEKFINRWEVEAADRGPTVWSVYSTLTNYASHNTGDFSIRSSSIDNDSVADTMLKREIDVRKWTEHPMFKEMTAK